MTALPPSNLLLAAVTLAGALGLMTLTARNFNRDTPPPLPTSSGPTTPGGRFENVRALFTPDAFPRLQPATNSPHPFFTTYFQPAPKPPTSTRNIEITYQGFFQLDSGEKNAYVQVGPDLVVGPVGTKLAGNLSVSAIDLPALTLTLGDTQTTTLRFRTKTNLQVTLE